MNSRLLPALLAVLASRLVSADAPAPAPCCPAPAPQPSCCAEAPAAPRAAKSCCEELAAATPLTARSLYQLDATWTDDGARPFSLVSLRGRPVVIAMIFASCEYACPVLVNDVQRLRAALPEAERKRLQVVLVSFDVARDTPAALKTFRARMQLDENWTLLRGEATAVQELAMLLGVKFQKDARGQFAHSNLFTVLNTEGEIVRQQAGLNGDISESARVATLAGQ